VDYSSLVYSLVPIGFALLISAPGEDGYFDKQAKALCVEKKFDASIQPYMAATAKSAVALHNQFETMTSGLLTLVLAFNVWPTGLRYIAVVILVIAYLACFRTWIWRIFSLDLYEITTSRPQKKGTRFATHTFAQLFKVQQFVFNIFGAAVITLGWAFSQHILNL
jgi:hypothetical protein